MAGMARSPPTHKPCVRCAEREGGVLRGSDSRFAASTTMRVPRSSQGAGSGTLHRKEWRGFQSDQVKHLRLRKLCRPLGQPYLPRRSQHATVFGSRSRARDRSWGAGLGMGGREGVDFCPVTRPMGVVFRFLAIIQRQTEGVRNMEDSCRP